MQVKTLGSLLEFLQEGGFPIEKLENARPVSGGSINDCYHLETDAGDFFLKLNDAKKFPDMFFREMLGLQRLAEARVLPVPRDISVGETEDGKAYFVMQYIPGGDKGEKFWPRFGRGLARLHQNSEEEFGLDHPNFIGSLVQNNDWKKDWPTFFAEMRIEPMLRLARDASHFQKADIQKFETLLKKIIDLVPDERPALLHGDLWSGNFMSDRAGNPVLFDPAIYCGHREMDIAMTKLFGGFDAEFYRFYNEEYPLEKGWEQRVDLHNLYPLLVHVNLFGGGYIEQVRGILRQFS